MSSSTSKTTTKKSAKSGSGNNGTGNGNGSSSSNANSTKRILAELAQLNDGKDPLPPYILRLGPSNEAGGGDDITRWTAVLKGPGGGSAYEDGVWRVDVRLPEGYPMKPPECRFVTRCCHPNVGWTVCLSSIA